MATKVKLLKALVWPVATYGCVSWTLRKAEETKINTFEVKFLRFVGLLRISWTKKRTNEWVLQSAGTERHLLKSARKRKMTYFGHIIRKKDIEVLREGNNPRYHTDARARSRLKTNWLVVGQYQTVDNGRTAEDGRGQTTVEDCCSWCGQPYNRG